MNTNTKKPTFDEFRKIFLDQLNLVYDYNITDSFYRWNEVGNNEIRLNVLESFYNKILELYGFDMEVDKTLSELDGFIESVVVKIYHNYNTIYLVEQINSKIKARMN